MLPGSHVVPINESAVKSLQSPKQLADAFSEFISASAQLENSYRGLQREVGLLGRELAERNAALTRSLAENEAMRRALEQMIDSMPCGVLVLDVEDGVVTINPEGRRLLQLGSTEVRTLRDVAAASTVDLGRMLDGEDQGERQVCVGCGESRRWLAISSRRLSGAGLRAVGGAGTRGLDSIWILRDVTAARQAEQEREAARNAMALAEVSAILAHEIRNPLASMELFAGLLLEEPQQSLQWVSHLRAGIRLLSATVNNVLSLKGETSVSLKPVELSEVVRSAVEFVRPIAEQAAVNLSFCSEDEIEIQANECQLRQVLLNPLCNAIRHTPAEGKVLVTTRTVIRDQGRRAVVEVCDTGCGIPEGEMGRVFDAGFSGQGDRPGLGLAVCKRIVQRHGGEIRVSSSAPGGSTFELEFAAC